MMYTDTSLEQGEHHRDLRKLLVLVGKSVDRIVKDFSDTVPFVLRVEIAALEGHTVRFTFTFAETEDDDGVETLTHNESDQFFHLLRLGLLLLFSFVAFASLFIEHLGDGHVVFNDLNSFSEVIFPEDTLFIHN